MDIKCRVCLATTEAKMYHTLFTVFPEYMKTNLTVLDLLEIVTSTSVKLSDDLPNSICTACLKDLRDCYKFIEQFKSSQSWLLETFSQKSDPHQEHIVVKVEALDDKFSKPAILDMEGNDISQTDVQITKLKKVEKPKAKTTQRVKKKGSERKKTLVLKKDEDGVIVMSIEDVIKEENERTDKNEMDEDSRNFPDSNTDNLVSDEEHIIIETDHTYQKKIENEEMNIPNEQNSNLFVMSIQDVLDSDTKSVASKSKVKRKKTKGIITQSTDLVKNLEKKTRTRRNWKRKTDMKEDGEMFICDVCQNVYDSHKSLISHKYTIHVSGFEEKLKCPTCGLICKTRSSYTHHKKKHKGKQVSCDECDKVYLTTTQLKEHKKRVHGSGLPAKFLCNECGKRFKFSSALKYHLVSVHHAGDKPYMCRFCGFKCAQQSYLKRHERCHTDERPYQCKFCPRTFRGTAELSSHQLTHEGKTRYKCQYCSKGFIQTWNMKVHWLQHNGDYFCQMCNKSFIDENVLKFHYYHHHKIKNASKEASEESNSNDEQENSESLFFDLTEDTDTFGQDIFWLNIRHHFN